VQVIASRLIYTHLHLACGGSLIPAHLFHASFDTSVGLLPVLPMARDGAWNALAVSVVLLMGIAVVTAIRFGRTT
jgi:hypothetical protein